jgi:hypothetical protein
MTTTESPQPVPDSEEEQPLPAPEGRPAAEWAKRAEEAQEARELGLRLRKGKPVTFRSRRHLAR